MGKVKIITNTPGKAPKPVKHADIADVKRMKEYQKKAHILNKIINREERKIKMNELKRNFDHLINQYEVPNEWYNRNYP